MKITSERTRELLAKAGAVIEGHFVGTSGKHLSVYVAKDRATRLTSITSELCEGIAERFAGDDIDAVVAPAVGAIALSQWTAHHLSRLRPDRPEVLALYSEHEETVILEATKSDIRIELPEGSFDRENDKGEFTLHLGSKLLIKKPSLALKRGFDTDVRGKRILGVEDILTTGESAGSTAKAIVSAGGMLVAIMALVNGGNVTATDLGINRLESLMILKRQIFTREECASHGLCANGVPVNTEFGHGAAFLVAQKSRG